MSLIVKQSKLHFFSVSPNVLKSYKLNSLGKIKNVYGVIWVDYLAQNNQISLHPEYIELLGVNVGDRVELEQLEDPPLAKLVEVDADLELVFGALMDRVYCFENQILNVLDKKVKVLRVEPSFCCKMDYDTKIKFKKSFKTPNLAGLPMLNDLELRIHASLFKQEEFFKLSIPPPKGILLYGPPGTGKTLIAKYLASKLDCDFFALETPDYENKSSLKRVFEKARANEPCVLFFDEIDSLLSSNLTSHFVAQLDKSERVFVLAATNRPNDISDMLRQPGRFDLEINIPVPTSESRRQILNAILNDFTHSLSKMQINEISDSLHGFVGADIRNLCRSACLKAKTEPITYDLLVKKSKKIKPSSLRECELSVPNVKWSDIGGYEDVKQSLRECIEWPLKIPMEFKKFNITPPKGVLLHGPPGCCKTLVAKALATECKLNFIAVKGPELYSKYVGDSEKSIKNVFSRARAAAPCIIFFDEIDAIASKRGLDISVTDRVLSQLLCELDGIEPLVNVCIVAATNRIDLLDSAILRPGRIDRIIHVGLPDLEARKQIVELQLKKMKTNITIDLPKKLQGCSGAEIVQIFQEAAMNAIESNHDEITNSDMEKALLLKF